MILSDCAYIPATLPGAAPLWWTGDPNVPTPQNVFLEPGQPVWSYYYFAGDNRGPSALPNRGCRVGALFNLLPGGGPSAPGQINSWTPFSSGSLRFANKDNPTPPPAKVLVYLASKTTTVKSKQYDGGFIKYKNGQQGVWGYYGEWGNYPFISSSPNVEIYQKFYMRTEKNGDVTLWLSVQHFPFPSHDTGLRVFPWGGALTDTLVYFFNTAGSGPGLGNLWINGLMPPVRMVITISPNGATTIVKGWK